MDALKAAVAAGCDAVYLGSTLFSARAFAGNFDHDQMIEAIRYCHDRDVRVYVTMNTLLYETEIDNAMKEAGFEVYYMGLRQTVDSIAKVAKEKDVNIIEKLPSGKYIDYFFKLFIGNNEKEIAIYIKNFMIYLI